MDSEYWIAFFLFVLLIGLPLYVLGLLIVLPCVIILTSLYMTIRGFISDGLELYYIERRAREVVQEARDRARDRTYGAPA
jgi:hypothetical protein